MDPARKLEPRRPAVYAGLDESFVGAQGDASRPLCLCVPGGVPMYVARHGEDRLVKRMPRSGYQHAPWCPHHGPPAQRRTGSPTVDAPGGAPPSKVPAAGSTPGPEGSGQDHAADARRVRLLALLHELWTRAELTRWHPGFAGKRHWGIVRRHVLHAARLIRTPAGAVLRRLYVPEVFNVERADRIRERREARWRWIEREDGNTLPSMIVIGELKALRPGHRVARAWLKHVPDCPFVLRGSVLGRIEEGFDAELAMWGRHGDLHMVCIAAVARDRTGVATVVDIELMLCSPEWIPLADEHDLHLIAKLVETGRCFTKELDEAPVGSALVLAALLREPPTAVELFIDRRGGSGHGAIPPVSNAGDRTWVWRPAVEPLPQFPGRRTPATRTFTAPGHDRHAASPAPVSVVP